MAGAAIALGGFGTVVVGGVIEMATAGRSAKRHNRERALVIGPAPIGRDGAQLVLGGVW